MSSMSGYNAAQLSNVSGSMNPALANASNINAQGVFGNNPNVGKKAVHVKWAGKTIALGTFPHAEADEKCARAKALTRAWRSTMRPKPSREWVMLELERQNVRVVSGRMGRKDEDEVIDGNDCDDDDDSNDNEDGNVNQDTKKVIPSVVKDHTVASKMGTEKLLTENNSHQTSIMNPKQNKPFQQTQAMPPHRPLVGGGAAAAYEASRAYHYNSLNAAGINQQEKKNDEVGAIAAPSKDRTHEVLVSKSDSNSNNTNDKITTSQSLGKGQTSKISSAPMPQLGLSVNPNQHYEMLKLHHMNLLNEIQETTLMMNLYQQQQLQQQQSIAEQQSLALPSPEQQLALQLAQQQQSPSASPFLESLYGMGAGSMNPSHQYSKFQSVNGFQQSSQQPYGLGFGGSGNSGVGSTNNQMQSLLRQQQHVLSGGMFDDVTRLGALQKIRPSSNENELIHEAKLEQLKLEQLKQDIAQRQLQIETMERNVSEARNNCAQDNVANKRQRI